MGRAWHDGVQGTPRSASVGGRALSPSLPLPALEISGPYRASPEMPVLWGPGPYFCSCLLAGTGCTTLLWGMHKPHHWDHPHLPFLRPQSFCRGGRPCPGTGPGRDTQLALNICL